jgi:hypothetical protein
VHLGLLVDTFQRLQPGDYLIRLKKKPIKLQQITLEANDKIVITASRRIEINYVMQELCIKLSIQTITNSSNF